MNQSLIHPSKTLEIVATEEHAMSKLLELAIQEEGLQDYLQKGIEMMIDLVPYLNIVAPGAIFLTETKHDTTQLQLVAQYNLPPEIQKRCRVVRYGDCVCGVAALNQEPEFASCVSESLNMMYPGWCRMAILLSLSRWIVPLWALSCSTCPRGMRK